ncbi:hypothetical protein [Stappia sp.]|uniref:hypothetical protein n=1 Tax=Stappia sp. TaxID=1870903 RepID=UPI0032D8DE9F
MGQLRRRARALAARVRQGDAEAAGALLAHSVSQGHGKLALRRFLLARALGARVSAADKRYCARIVACLPVEAVAVMAEEEWRKAMRYRGRETFDG